MSGLELIKGLEATGSGPYYLRPASLKLLEKRDASAEELAMELDRAGPIYSVTAGKARGLIAGRSPDSFNGKPPPQGQEAKELRMAKILAESNEKTMAALAEKIAERQGEAQVQKIGMPERPAIAGNKPK